MKKALQIVGLSLFACVVHGSSVASGESTSAVSREPHVFALGESEFLLDGKPFVIHCGEVHYARIPRDYWRHRLQMLHAMGCNALGCYMFWNFHEREPGKFTWEGRADAAAFCRMAQEEGLCTRKGQS